MHTNTLCQGGEAVKIEVRIARLIKRLSQHALAREVGFSQAKVSLIENGFAVPSESDREKIATALSLNAHEIDWLERPLKSNQGSENDNKNPTIKSAPALD